MSAYKNESMKRRVKAKIDCCECKTQSDCCKFGAWIDLEEAKKIISLGIKGEFFQLEADNDFPSGFRIGTSYNDECCSFLDKDGLCAVHKVGYHFKPNTCKEFPYEGGKISPFANYLCTLHKKKRKKKKQADK